MKLCLTIAALALACGCARQTPAASPGARDQVGEAQLTAANVGKTEPAPKVGKSQRELGEDTQDALEPKRLPSREGTRKSGGFGDWK